MKVLNLYAGIGGNRKLWEDVEVTAVEWDKATADVYKEYFPDDKVIVTDAHQYLIENFKEYDFIWSSPPCPTHSRLNFTNAAKDNRLLYPDMKLYQEIIFLSSWFDGKYCVENVIPYYEPLIEPTKKLHRHYYWCNFRFSDFNDYDKERNHNGFKGSDGLYGYDIMDSSISDKRKALRNMVDPALGLHILNAARNIITKPKTKQAGLFENESAKAEQAL